MRSRREDAVTTPRTPGEGAGTAARVERFRAWLEALGDALESGDAAAAERLFVLEATWRPGPFAPPLRGRRAIRAHLESLIAQRAGVAIRGRALGMGATYGVAHWVAAWPVESPARWDDPGTGDERALSERVADGIMLVAFDPMGRCTSLREWSVEEAADATVTMPAAAPDDDAPRPEGQPRG
jgi:hypothetical protein